MNQQPRQNLAEDPSTKGDPEQDQEDEGRDTPEDEIEEQPASPEDETEAEDPK